MNNRTTVIVFLAIFAVGIVLFVVLPFIFFRGPSEPEEPGVPPPSGEPADVPTQGVFRSDNGGRTWDPADAIEGRIGSIAGFRIRRLIPHPTDPDTLFAATESNGLWESRSRGALWAQIADDESMDGGLAPMADVLSVAINPDDPREWYVAAYQDRRGRLFRSLDDGNSFTEVYRTPSERFGVFDAYYDSDTRAVWIITGQGGLLESRDRGETWRVVRWFADGLIRMLVSPRNEAVRFLVTPEGRVFRTEDRGASWVDITPNFRQFSGATAQQAWFIDSDGNLYLGSAYGLLRSRDHGDTFTAPPLIVPPESLPVRAVAAHPAEPFRVAAAAANQLYRSDDDGLSWSILISPPGSSITDLLFHPTDRSVIFAITTSR
ncbi:hypothetical protein C4552_00070 [Candidatus Parcubacteria bacterium]|nr:MAG: hypothetical protein C4552_00070 [Candidatus Parcubacteria bacterium]